MDAARRQLETALLLYFNSQDVLAIHTLASASYELLKDLHGPGLIERSAEHYLDEATMAELRRFLRKPQNFLKHASRDPEATLEFSSRSTDLMLLEAAAKFVEVTGEHPHLLIAFEKWFFMHHPEFLTSPDHKAMIEKAARTIWPMTRLEFLRQFLVTAVKLGGAT